MIRAVLVAGLLWAAAAFAQQPAADSKNGSDTVDLVLERQESGAWKTVDAQLVLHSGDQIRFRCRTSFSGYVYVWNRSSSAETSALYPRPGHGSARFQAGVWYLIPGDKAYFTVGGPPGFDITYWLISPRPLMTDPPAEPSLAYPNTARPRCREGPLRSRGLCMDSDAGPRRMEDPDSFRSKIGLSSGLRVRDLTFHSQAEAARISAPAAGGVIVYEYRIAHE